jgi:hypothetical protein
MHDNQRRTIEICSLLRCIHHFTNLKEYTLLFKPGMIAYRYSIPISVLRDTPRNFARLDAVNVGTDVYITSILSATMRNYLYDNDPILESDDVLRAIEQQHTLYEFKLLNNNFLFMHNCSNFPDKFEIAMTPGMKFQVIHKEYRTIATLPDGVTGDSIINYRQIYCVTLQQITQEEPLAFPESPVAHHGPGPAAAAAHPVAHRGPAAAAAHPVAHRGPAAAVQHNPLGYVPPPLQFQAAAAPPPAAAAAAHPANPNIFVAKRQQAPILPAELQYPEPAYISPQYPQSKLYYQIMNKLNYQIISLFLIF